MNVGGPVKNEAKPTKEFPTPYRVHCPTHGGQCLSREDYNRQLSRPDSLWVCPVCGENAWWDDEWYENAMEVIHGEEGDES